MKHTFIRYGLIIVTMLTALTYCGIYTFASPCPPVHAGMHCVKARNIIANVLEVMLIISILGIVNLKPLRVISAVVTSILSLGALLLPGTILPLCMLTSMRCYTHMQPFVRVMMTITLIYSVVYSVVCLEYNKEKSNECTEAGSK